MVRRTDNAKNRHAGKIVALIAVIVVIVWGAWFFRTHEYVNNGTVYVPISKASQPFYASKVLLENEGKSVEILSGNTAFKTLSEVWQDTTSADNTTVLIKQISQAEDSHLDEILTWVDAGGHLVVFSQASYKADDDLEAYESSQNPILTRLGIQVNHSQEQGVWQDDSSLYSLNLNTLLKMPDGSFVVIGEAFGERVNMNADLPSYHDYTPFVLPSRDELVSVFGELDEKLLNELQNDLTTDNLLNAPSASVLDVKVGQGRVTVLSSSKLFDNPRPSRSMMIATSAQKDEAKESRTWQLLTDGGYEDGQDVDYVDNLMWADNAYFLHYLTQNSQQVYLVNNPKNQNLLQLMWQNAQAMIWAIVATCLLGLLALPRQFGRVQALKDTQSRDVFVFFASIGQYLWATDHAKELVNSNRKQLFERICAVYPAVKNERPKEVCEILANKTHLSETLIYQALYEQYGDSQNDFLEITQAFAKLNQYFS